MFYRFIDRLCWWVLWPNNDFNENELLINILRSSNSITQRHFESNASANAINEGIFVNYPKVENCSSTTYEFEISMFIVDPILWINLSLWIIHPFFDLKKKCFPGTCVWTKIKSMYLYTIEQNKCISVKEYFFRWGRKFCLTSAQARNSESQRIDASSLIL